jgi:hypothetical protein
MSEEQKKKIVTVSIEGFNVEVSSQDFSPIEVVNVLMLAAQSVQQRLAQNASIILPGVPPKGRIN